MFKGCNPHGFIPCILFLHHLKARTSKVWKKCSILLFHRLPHTHHKKTVLPLASPKFISFSTSPIQVKPHIPLLLPIWCLYTSVLLLNHIHPSPTLSSLIYSATWSPLSLRYPFYFPPNLILANKLSPAQSSTIPFFTSPHTSTHQSIPIHNTAHSSSSEPQPVIFIYLLL